MSTPEFNKNTIKKLSQLSRIDCTEEEQEMLLQDLMKIFNYIDQLDEIDTTDVVPCNHVLEEIYNVMREDEVGPQLDRGLFLSNASSQTAGMVRVPPVIKQN